MTLRDLTPVRGLLQLLRTRVARAALLAFFGFASGPMVVAVMSNPAASESTRQSGLPTEEKSGEEDASGKHRLSTNAHERKTRHRETLTADTRPQPRPHIARHVVATTIARVAFPSIDQHRPLRC